MRIPTNSRRRGRTGRNTGRRRIRSRECRDGRRQRHNAGRHSVNSRPQQIQDRRKGGALHTNKSHRGETNEQ